MKQAEPIQWIVSKFEANGHLRYSEEVSELEHALQTATFAQQQDEPDEIVVACLLHDFGHLCHELGEDVADRGVDAMHEDVGAQILGDLFPPVVVEPIRMHVAAKRYLCWKEPDYFNGLSPASRQSLELQGGPMSSDEARDFEQSDFFENAIRVRKYDDMGKVVGMQTPSIDSFLPKLSGFLKC